MGVSARSVRVGTHDTHQLVFTATFFPALQKIPMDVGDDSVSGRYDIARVFDVVVNVGDDVVRVFDIMTDVGNNGAGIHNIFTDVSNNGAGTCNVLTDVGDDHMCVDRKFGLETSA